MEGIVKNFQTKALAEGADTTGGYLVPTEYVPQLIELLRKKTVVEGISRHIIMHRDVMNIPSQSAGATAYWPDEAGGITESDQTFGQVTLTAKKIAGATRASTELVEDAKINPEVATIILDDLASVIAIELDNKMINGTAGDSLLGLVNQSNILEVAATATDGDKLTFEKFMDAIQKMQEENVDPNTRKDAYWLMNPRDITYARKIKDTDGQYIWQPAVASDVPATICGIPYKMTNQISKALTTGASTDCSFILLVCGNEILVGDRREYRVEQSREAEDVFLKDQVLFKVTARKAFALRHAKAVCKITGITPSGA